MDDFFVKMHVYRVTGKGLFQVQNFRQGFQDHWDIREETVLEHETPIRLLKFVKARALTPTDVRWTLCSIYLENAHV